MSDVPTSDVPMNDDSMNSRTDAAAASVSDLHFTMGEPLPIGEPMIGRDGSVIGTVISCTDDCAEAFHVVVRPAPGV